MNILLTGGAGYIGSHTCVILQQLGFSVIIYDNFSNSSLSVIDEIKKISGHAPDFVQGDILDFHLLKSTLKRYKINAVIHFAGLKSVKESVDNPSRYHRVNVEGSKNLFKAMEACKIFSIIFSSSATVYGDPVFLPITESHPLNPKNPYGDTKLEVERCLESLAAQNSKWRIVSLRYFNPIGAHDSGLIYENGLTEQSNIMPVLLKVASGQKKFLEVYGDDYNTKDGTGIRDYIHILDLVDGHIMAYKKLKTFDKFFDIFNLGTGEGYSVSEIINVFEKVNKVKIPFEIYPRRKGDVSISYATSTKAKDFFGWKSKNNLKEMCKSEYNHKRILYKNPV